MTTTLDPDDTVETIADAVLKHLSVLDAAFANGGVPNAVSETVLDGLLARRAEHAA